MGILQNAKANILKNKSTAILLALLVLIISMMMGVGLPFMTQISSVYDRKAEELGSLHVMYGMPKNEFKPEYETYFQNDSRVVTYNRETAVFMKTAIINYCAMIDNAILLQNKDAPRTISPMIIVEEDLSIPPENAIYLPYYAKQIGYNMGDKYIIEYRNKAYNFDIAGFFEASEMTRLGYAVKHFLTEEAFSRMRDQIGETVIMTAILTDNTQGYNFVLDFEKSNNIDPEPAQMSERISIEYLGAKNTQITSIMVFAAILVGFSVIAVIISMVVINFRVKNSIEDRMRNIGVLGAAGYTANQIKGAFILEYVIVALPAALAGMIVSILMMPVIHSLLLTMTGMFLRISPQIAMSLTAALSITCILVLMVMISCRRIKKLPPVVALRGGIATHSFRRNYFPLYKGFGSVHMRLGLKNMILYGKLYSMIGFVLLGVSVIISF
jgi:putative ABC transport system permease protein